MFRAMSRAVFMLASAIILGLSSGAHATTYDAVADFSSSNPSGPWSYGYGTTGSSFTPYSTFSGGCAGYAAFCWNTGNVFVPWVASNPGPGPINNGTVMHPPGVLNVHPGPGIDSIVKWTAPTSATYSITGLFEVLDIAPSGVIVSVFLNSTQLLASTLLGPAASRPSTPGGSVPFSFTQLLNAGDQISFGVNDYGAYGFDSTGLAATISTAGVPEPAPLALVLTGLLGMGFLYRNRKPATPAV